MAWLLPPQQYATAVFGDLVQSLLLVALLVSTVRNVVATNDRTRLFWTFISLWAAGWLTGTLIWSWYEVVLQLPIPDLFLCDMLFFLLPVVLMGALAVLPHTLQHEGPLSFSWLDFLLLLLFWVYLYVVAVTPWQYVIPDIPNYSRNFDLLYAIEGSLPAFTLFVLWRRTEGNWRRFYGLLFLGTAIWSVSVPLENYAITTNRYYSGSLFDLGDTIAILLFIAAARTKELPVPERKVSARYVGLIASRVAMAAIYSLPFIAVWAYWMNMPLPVKKFRLMATAVALIVLPLLGFLKRHFLDRELTSQWEKAQASYRNLQRSHALLVRTERLAAQVQLISVAAHETSSPLTVILCESEMMSEDATLPQKARSLSADIFRQARRATEGLNHLRQMTDEPPNTHDLLNLNNLLEDALQLTTLDIENYDIMVIRNFETSLPPVIGSSNQLLHVFFCLIGRVLDDLQQSRGGSLSVSSRTEDAKVVIQIAEVDGIQAQEHPKILDLFSHANAAPDTNTLALSACYSIVQEHAGTLSYQPLSRGGSAFTVELPRASELFCMPSVTAEFSADMGRHRWSQIIGTADDSGQPSFRSTDDES